jgi:E3 ubiquitin-protein ligase MYCBP2
VYHEACVLEKLRKRWSGTRITFGFLDCSQCKAPMQHPSPPIQTLLQPILALRKEVSAKALARLTIENMTKDAKLVDPKSQFYNKPEAYAMASFAYYNCFKYEWLRAHPHTRSCTDGAAASSYRRRSS